MRNTMGGIMTSEKPIEDQVLIDLFRYRQAHGSRRTKPLTEYHEHSQVLARLVGDGDIARRGHDQFRITDHGQHRITAKYPELSESSRPSWLCYPRPPNKRKPGAYGKRHRGHKGKL